LFAKVMLAIGDQQITSIITAMLRGRCGCAKAGLLRLSSIQWK
jgi:hypothetical protein